MEAHDLSNPFLTKQIKRAGMRHKRCIFQIDFLYVFHRIFLRIVWLWEVPKHDNTVNVHVIPCITWVTMQKVLTLWLPLSLAKPTMNTSSWKHISKTKQEKCFSIQTDPVCWILFLTDIPAYKWLVIMHAALQKIKSESNFTSIKHTPAPTTFPTGASRVWELPDILPRFFLRDL